MLYVFFILVISSLHVGGCEGKTAASRDGDKVGSADFIGAVSHFSMCFLFAVLRS